MNNYYKNFDFKTARVLIQMALEEDIKKGDITSENLINKESISKAELLLKEDGIVAGLELFKRVFLILDKRIKFNFSIKEGKFYKKGTLIGVLSGNTISLLKGERTALNILQRISGIATKVYFFRKRLKNEKINLLDTRKTTPNFRIFEKLGVVMGGGINHRFGLYDMMLIKDNHIEANGGILNTLQKVKKLKLKVKKEIEVKNLEEVKIVYESGFGIVDIVMLDNFSISDIKKSISILAKKFKIEISGGINEKTITRFSKISGIDYISVGAFTHSVKSVDISLNFN
jgi:nicotinate-nucleotide pyrophosphorylase (carboxylating)